MNKTVTYGFFGEDIAQRNFLAHYLNQQYPNTFIENEDFRWKVKVRNRDQVDAFLSEALLQKVIFRLDVLFVGRDIDTAHQPTVKTRREDFEKKCANEQPVMLMLPVQCIEHWLWYIKRKQEEPGKNSLLESYPRPDAKQAIYGDSKTEKTKLEKANAVLTHFDIDWLAQHSESFRHFHNQVKAFLSRSK